MNCYLLCYAHVFLESCLENLMAKCSVSRNSYDHIHIYIAHTSRLIYDKVVAEIVHQSTFLFTWVGTQNAQQTPTGLLKTIGKTQAKPFPVCSLKLLIYNGLHKNSDLNYSCGCILHFVWSRKHSKIEERWHINFKKWGRASKNQRTRLHVKSLEWLCPSYWF